MPDANADEAILLHKEKKRIASNLRHSLKDNSLYRKIIHNYKGFRIRKVGAIRGRQRGLNVGPKGATYNLMEHNVQHIFYSITKDGKWVDSALTFKQAKRRVDWIHNAPTRN